MAEIEVNSLNEVKDILNTLNDGSINRPSEKEVEVAKKEFDNATKNFNETLFKIGEPKEFEEIINFLLTFIEKYVYWTKNGWMGVIKLYEELIATKKKNRKTGTYFTLAYQALEFVFYVLSNPGGNGLESAKEIEKLADIYAKVYEYVGKQLEEARKILKKIQYAQDKYTAMQQGFYYEREDGVELKENNKIPNKTIFEIPSAEDLLKQS